MTTINKQYVPITAGYPGDKIRVTIQAESRDKDFYQIGLEVEGQGMVGLYDIYPTPFPYTEVSRWFEVVLPDHGPFRLRGYASDHKGNSYNGDWVEVEVVTVAPPTTEYLSTWFRVTSTEISPGVINNAVEILPGAPPIVQRAIDETNLVNSILGGMGGYDPLTLYHNIEGRVRRMMAEQAAADVKVEEIVDSGYTPEEINSVVGYIGDDPEPVYNYELAPPVLDQVLDRGIPTGLENIAELVEIYQPVVPVPDREPSAPMTGFSPFGIQPTGGPVLSENEVAAGQPVAIPPVNVTGILVTIGLALLSR